MSGRHRRLTRLEAWWLRRRYGVRRSVTVPGGIITTTRVLTAEDARRIRELWSR